MTPHSFTISLILHIDDLHKKTPTVTDVSIVEFNGQPVYTVSLEGRCTQSILAEVTARSRPEALLAMVGLLEHDINLAWTHAYENVSYFIRNQIAGQQDAKAYREREARKAKESKKRADRDVRRIASGLGAKSKPMPTFHPKKES